MSIFITGDCHADFTKFNIKNFPEQKELTRNDYVIVCGDFGGIWDGSKQDEYWLRWLSQKNFTLLFVGGNHENYDMLSEYEVSEWHGGKVQFIKDNVIHLMRGQCFEIEGRKFFTFGGASSHDISDGILEPDDPDFKAKFKKMAKENKLFRVNHQSWWKEELPSQEEIEIGRKTLENNNWQVDYIITHCLSTIAQDILQDRAGCHCFDSDILTDFLSEVRNKCKFRHWFCGHYHINTDLTNKETILYEEIVKLVI